MGLRVELDRAMGLLGVGTVDELKRRGHDLIKRRGASAHAYSMNDSYSRPNGYRLQISAHALSTAFGLWAEMVIRMLDSSTCCSATLPSLSAIFEMNLSVSSTPM